MLAEVLSEKAGHKVVLAHRVRGEKARWLQLGVENAEQALAARLSSQAGMSKRLQLLQQVLKLEQLPNRIECFDISHTQGEGTVASCVVFDRDGPRKSDYRRFNIRDIVPRRRLCRHAAGTAATLHAYETGRCQACRMWCSSTAAKGSSVRAQQVVQELQIDEMLLVGVSKGPERKPGMEVLHIPAQQRHFDLEPSSPALHLVQQIRDEAHRFAITGHRQRRAKARAVSPLEAIPGVGPRRRQQLLKQFGGMQEVARAGVEDLCGVPGISRALAQQIYDAFHGDN